MTREQAVQRLMDSGVPGPTAASLVSGLGLLGVIQFDATNDPVYLLTRKTVEVEYTPYAGDSPQRFLSKRGAQQVVDILRDHGFKITKE